MEGTQLPRQLRSILSYDRENCGRRKMGVGRARLHPTATADRGDVELLSGHGRWLIKQFLFVTDLTLHPNNAALPCAQVSRVEHFKGFDRLLGGHGRRTAFRDCSRKIRVVIVIAALFGWTRSTPEAVLSVPQRSSRS